jgi:hypothetical protein
MARDFLERALPVARLAADIPDQPNDDPIQQGDEELEGMIAAALLSLDGDARLSRPRRCLCARRHGNS